MMKDKVTASLKSFGVPRLIIAGFLLLLLIMAPFVGADLPTQISNIINRFSWNGILVLAMVPMAAAMGDTLEMMSDMGITMMSGMIISTIVTLLFTPVYYSVIDDLPRRLRRKKKSLPPSDGDGSDSAPQAQGSIPAPQSPSEAT